MKYPGEVTTPVSGIKTAKTLINSTISTPDSRFFSIHIKLLSQQTNGPLQIHATAL